MPDSQDSDADSDGDGVADSQDNDDDGDGISDDKDADTDSDGDGTPDVKDNDDDNDGTPDSQDNDDDGDGIADNSESLCSSNPKATACKSAPSLGVGARGSAGTMYIGNKEKKGSQIVAVDVATNSIIQTYKTDGLTHAAGITVVNNVLYVLGQDDKGGSLYSFDVQSGNFIGETFTFDGDVPEQIISTPC